MRSLITGSIENVMSKKGDLEIRFLTACEQGELQIIRELVQSKAVNPTAVVDKRRKHIVRVADGSGYYTDGWTPLHYAAA